VPKNLLVEITEVDDAMREAAAAAEISGRHTLFTRNDKPVAILLSHDEYLALAETVAIAADPSLLTRIGLAEQELVRGDVYDAEDLLVE
jgi:PHD/YefM family antitoxin component YafN of YafNO toxin-antitoxin module